MIKRLINYVLNNNSDNIAHPDSGAVLVGRGLRSNVSEQTIYGKYNDTTGDSSSDMVQIGSGKNEKDRNNAIRVTKDGELVLQGGEVYMISPDTGELIPVYMLGSNNRYKKIYLSK